MTDGAETVAAGAFAREDAVCGAGASAFALAVYLATLSPSVTFLDSGELIVAAQHFGVPHPPGYPLWTFATWLFQLLPLGNAAWECNLFSAICAAFAVGVFAGLINASARFCFPGCAPGLRRVIATGSAAAAACGISVWSQAVIAEVYSLHLLLAALFLCALFRWCARPRNLFSLLPVLFFFALAFANHHLVLTLSPLVPLAILLARRALFVQAMVWLTLLASYFYGAYAWLSGRTLDLEIAERFMLVSLIAAIAYILARRDHVQWAFPVKGAALVGLGLLAYIYLPIASLTNPPMNWGYTQDPKGFFYVVNRSQYHGPLSFQIRRTLGRVLRVGAPAESEIARQATAGQTGKFSFEDYREFVVFLGGKIMQSLSPLGLALIAASLFGLWRLDGLPRAWIAVVACAFFLAAFFQPALDGARSDWLGWSQQMPYHGLTFCLAAALMAFGAFALVEFGPVRGRPATVALAIVFLATPGYAFFVNHDVANLRGNWLAWEMGHRMLGELPENSILLAGSDHGRFISTYMIFGESPQPGNRKRDPDFDRRDIFIVTQNQLVAPFYLRTLHDQYGDERPDARGPAGFLFDRKPLYPTEELDLPSAGEIATMARAHLDRRRGRDLSLAICNDAARAFWLRNRDDHPFFVEQSFEMPWIYPFAVPDGLLLKLMPEKTSGISQEVVADDRAFWEALAERLESDPVLRSDENARVMLAGCRTSIARLYRHHGMDREARHAYREALAFYSAHPGALDALGRILVEDGEMDAAKTLIENALESDPRNRALRKALASLDSPAWREKLLKHGLFAP